jgi:hypothetical protein
MIAFSYDACAFIADCFALTLAIYENGTLVTSDHHELDRLAQLCPILFIR